MGEGFKIIKLLDLSKILSHQQCFEPINCVIWWFMFEFVNRTTTNWLDAKGGGTKVHLNNFRFINTNHKQTIFYNKDFIIISSINYFLLIILWGLLVASSSLFFILIGYASNSIMLSVIIFYHIITYFKIYHKIFI